MDESIAKLQEYFCHQAEDIARLSDEVFAQQKEIKSLRAELSALKKERSIAKDQVNSDVSVTEEQKPPHY